MTLPSSGAISMQALATEFGQALTVPLESYYAGSGIVPNPTSNATGVTVPTSGAISLANFYGVSAFVSHLDTFSTPGPVTITIPVGATTALIEVWGSSSFGGTGSGSGLTQSLGGGSGSGAYTKTFLTVSGHGGQTLKANVGTAGLSTGTTATASNVASGTFSGTFTAMNSGAPAQGGNAPSSSTPGTPSAGGVATGGASINSNGNIGSGRTGGAGVVGTNGTGAAGGNGGLGTIQTGRTNGGNGLIKIAWS